MDKKTKTAIVLGATGLTGSILTQLLLEDKNYKKIKLFSRSTVGFEHEKLEEHLVDVINLDTSQKCFTGDDVFCCIGTTADKTPNKELYKRIDYGIPVNAAKLCKVNKIDTFIVISALGANSTSSIFYNRTKGEMEDAILKINIVKTHILQPSLIGGSREEKRVGEWWGKQFFKLLNPFLYGSFKKYRSIDPSVIAKCMLLLANHSYKQNRISSDEIYKIGIAWSK